MAPFECSQCSKFFRDKCDFNRHLTTKTHRQKIKENNEQKNKGAKSDFGDMDLQNVGMDLQNVDMDLQNGDIDLQNDILTNCKKQKNDLKCNFCFDTFKNQRTKGLHLTRCKLKDDPVRLLEIELDIKEFKHIGPSTCRFCEKTYNTLYYLPIHYRSCRQKEKYHKDLLKQKEQREIDNTKGKSIQIINNTITNNQTNIITNNQNNNVVIMLQQQIEDFVTAKNVYNIVQRILDDNMDDPIDYDYIASRCLMEVELEIQKDPKNVQVVTNKGTPICNYYKDKEQIGVENFKRHCHKSFKTICKNMVPAIQKIEEKKIITEDEDNVYQILTDTNSPNNLKSFDQVTRIMKEYLYKPPEPYENISSS
jgi:hypothetical protein